LMPPPPLPPTSKLAEEQSEKRAARHSHLAAQCAEGAHAATLKSSGYSAAELREVGYELQQLWDAKYSVPALCAAGFSPREVKRLKKESRRQAVASALKKQREVAEVSQARAAMRRRINNSLVNGGGEAGASPPREKWSVPTVSTGSRASSPAPSFSGTTCSSCSFVLPSERNQNERAELATAQKAMGVDVRELREGGFNASELLEAGYTQEELWDAGYSAQALGAAGVAPSSLKAFKIRARRKAHQAARAPEAAIRV
jgi:intracellular multiplication protein IcmE